MKLIHVSRLCLLTLLNLISLFPVSFTKVMLAGGQLEINVWFGPEKPSVEEAHDLHQAIVPDALYQIPHTMATAMRPLGPRCEDQLYPYITNSTTVRSQIQLCNQQ